MCNTRRCTVVDDAMKAVLKRAPQVANHAGTMTELL
jgi:hypothetical protein